MGWNSWDSYGASVTEALLAKQKAEWKAAGKISPERKIFFSTAVNGIGERAGNTALEGLVAALELTLMAVSSTIAVGGIALAALVWLRRRDLADAMAERFGGVYRLLLNKYYVDEIYDASVVRPIRSNGGGFVGIGCVAGVHSVGTSVCSTGTSGIGQTGCPLVRSKT
mgnify:CR=1 FL=1